MPILATRTVHRAFLGDGWGLRRALEAYQGVNAALKENHKARREAKRRGKRAAA